MKRKCDVPDCKDEAKWRQYDPVDTKIPVYLCTGHWNETRILDFERSVAYGPAHLFHDEEPDRIS